MVRALTLMENRYSCKRVPAAHVTWGGGAVSRRLRFLPCLLSRPQPSEGLRALAAVIMVNLQTR